MKKFHSIALLSLAVGLTLAPGEYISITAQHGGAGAAFTISNESAASMSTVAIASAIRDRLDAAGFKTIRVGQTITAMFVGSADADPVISVDGKTGAVSTAIANFPLTVELNDTEGARLQGVIVGAVVSAALGHIFNSRRHVSKEVA